MFQLQSDIGIFCGVFFHLFGNGIPHGSLVFSFFTDQGFNGNRSIIQVVFGQSIHIVALIGFDEVMGNHRVEKRPFHLNIVPTQYRDVVFKVLSNFFDGFIIEKWFKQPKQLLTFVIVVGQVYVPGMGRLYCKRHSHQLGGVGINGGGFGVETYRRILQQLLNQRLYLAFARNAKVFVRRFGQSFFIGVLKGVELISLELTEKIHRCSNFVFPCNILAGGAAGIVKHSFGEGSKFQLIKNNFQLLHIRCRNL